MTDKGKLNLTGGCDVPVPPVGGTDSKHTLDAPFSQAPATGGLPNVITVDIGERKNSDVIAKT